MYSESTRKIATRLRILNWSFRKISSVIDVSKSTLHRWFCVTNVTSRKQNFWKFLPKLYAAIIMNPFISVREYTRYLSKHGHNISHMTVFKAMRLQSVN
jgi:hypothetical protein